MSRDVVDDLSRLCVHDEMSERDCQWRMSSELVRADAGELPMTSFEADSTKRCPCCTVRVVPDLAIDTEVSSCSKVIAPRAVQRDTGNPDYSSLTDDVFRDF